MEKEFIPYEQALALKELGFDEPCFAHRYSNRDDDFHFLPNPLNNSQLIKENRGCAAPLYQQAFRFFREKYGLDVNYDVCIPTSYIPTIHFTSEIGLEYRCHEMLKFFGRRIFDSKEEARIESLKKLIGIVKNK